ncbi:unnamed protein product [Trichogramma brassicae]|uniref:TM2 domain-containing protein n=1 Tax=Trichogramma brassicae TaxID=86971 RepID=A0A6H5ICJ5_9HYME|nr:unnamed protein product [Trichogramma brassicae]
MKREFYYRRNISCEHTVYAAGTTACHRLSTAIYRRPSAGCYLFQFCSKKVSNSRAEVKRYLTRAQRCGRAQQTAARTISERERKREAAVLLRKRAMTETKLRRPRCNPMMMLRSDFGPARRIFPYKCAALSVVIAARSIESPCANSTSDSTAVVCPVDKQCSDLHVDCLICPMKEDCIYGASYTTNCSVREQVDCVGNKNFTKTYICRYCYQTEPSEHRCLKKNACNSVASPKQYYRSNCTVYGNILCLGNRIFNKNLPCNWTSGYKWSTALILSITLGGFGADRFYLGHWQEGIGKLFSFGGLGVWTLIDVMLISMRYLGPADGSLYIK